MLQRIVERVNGSLMFTFQKRMVDCPILTIEYSKTYIFTGNIRQLVWRKVFDILYLKCVMLNSHLNVNLHQLTVLERFGIKREDFGSLINSHKRLKKNGWWDTSIVYMLKVLKFGKSEAIRERMTVWFTGFKVMKWH